MVHELKVNIDAPTIDEAKKILAAMEDIKAALTTGDLISLAKIVTERPSIIQRAKLFFG